MAKVISFFWRIVLCTVPTWALQAALIKRPAVTARFVAPDEWYDLTVQGVCWVMISED